MNYVSKFETSVRSVDRVGLNGGCNSLFTNYWKLIVAKNGWDNTSSIPPVEPNLLDGSLSSNYKY